MNPFSFPFSGGTNWIELAIAVAAGVVGVIYLFHVFRPFVQRLLGPEPDPEARAAELLDAYRRQEQAEEKS